LAVKETFDLIDDFYKSSTTIFNQNPVSKKWYCIACVKDWENIGCPTRYWTRQWSYCNEIWTGVCLLFEKWRGMCL